MIILKLTILEEPNAEPELIVKCENAQDPEIQALLNLLAGRERRICVRAESTLIFLAPQEVLYCEYVDSGVFVYTAHCVQPTPQSLVELEQTFAWAGFFRCSKSMVVNLHHIRTLQSEAGGRIIAALSNTERILISRHYASALRQTLSNRKGESLCANLRNFISGG